MCLCAGVRTEVLCTRAQSSKTKCIGKAMFVRRAWRGTHNTLHMHTEGCMYVHVPHAQWCARTAFCTVHTWFNQCLHGISQTCFWILTSMFLTYGKAHVFTVHINSAREAAFMMSSVRAVLVERKVTQFQCFIYLRTGILRLRVHPCVCPNDIIFSYLCMYAWATLSVGK